MDKTSEFVSYKKLVIFGSEGSGKSTLTSSIEKGAFSEQSHTDNGK
jgi:GTPase SAR1 family protein